jgi:general secretion pathway protein D
MKNKKAGVIWSLLISAFAVTSLAATDAVDVKLKFSFKNAELSEMIERYAKVSGRKVIVDPAVRGRATIMLSGEVSQSEAFEALSDALAINGYSYVEKGDTIVVQTARTIQRGLNPVSTELPSLKPERMATWVYRPLTVTADELNKQLHHLVSKDGEMTAANGKLLFTDFTSTLHRIEKVLKEVDRK